MKLFKYGFSTFLLSIFLVSVSSNARAQDRSKQKKVFQTYNEALKLAKAKKYDQAVSKYKEALKGAQALGNGGEDVVKRVKAKLPSIYYQSAVQKYKTFQNSQTIDNVNATIDAFKNTQTMADKYGDSQLSTKADGIITQLLYNKSLVQYNNKSYNDALATLDQIIQNKPDYAKAYYQKGIITKNMKGGDFEEAMGYLDKAIQVGKKSNDNDVVRKATKTVSDQFLYRGSKAIENEHYSTAKKYLRKALKYDSDSATAEFRLAQAYNGTRDFKQAIAHAQKGLNYENGGRAAKAKIYFELGDAYQGLGKNQDACSAFDKASYGNFKSSANHKMKYVLKCKGA